jgi:GTP cyclohydrolase I
MRIIDTIGHLRLVTRDQKHLTTRIAHRAQEQLDPEGVGVMQEAALGEAPC